MPLPFTQQRRGPPDLFGNRQLRAPRAIVIGAGIGGLAAAIDLARTGADVTIVERAHQPGGKMREIDVQGHRIDSGPTVLTMPWVFEALFADCGTSLSDHVELQRAEILARHAWPGGGQLDLFGDRERSADAIAEFAGPGHADGFNAFCERAARIYQTLDIAFIRHPQPDLRSLITASGLRGLVDLWRLKPFRSLWNELGRYFTDPRLRSLFARYSTYCGASPLRAPATLMLIAHVEQCGVWRVAGGMQRLADAMASEVMRQGGEIRYGSAVHEIGMRAGRAVGVRMANDEWLPAEAVIANVDAAGIHNGELGPAVASAVPRMADGRRSLSAVTWSLVAETTGFELDHHNVFFPEDYPREFEEIFAQNRLPTRPAVYVCAQDKYGNAGFGDAHQRLFMIANAPANGDRGGDHDADTAALQAAVFGLLEDCGVGITTVPEKSIITTPVEFEARFPGTGGALYGSPPHGWRASFARPSARSRIPGLYLAGASAHPGPGVPMVALGGRHAARAVAGDLGLP